MEWKRWPRQFVRTLGRARLTIAASAPCMVNLESIIDPRKRKEDPMPSENNLFFFCMIKEETRLSTPHWEWFWNQSQFEEDAWILKSNLSIVDQEILWTRRACCIDRLVDEWRLSAVKLCDDSGHAWHTAGVIVSMTGLQLRFNCSAVPRRWPMLLLLPDNNVWRQHNYVDDVTTRLD